MAGGHGLVKGWAKLLFSRKDWKETSNWLFFEILGRFFETRCFREGRENRSVLFENGLRKKGRNESVIFEREKTWLLFFCAEKKKRERRMIHVETQENKSTQVAKKKKSLRRCAWFQNGWNFQASNERLPNIEAIETGERDSLFSKLS